MKVDGTIKSSREVMRSMSSLIELPELKQTMQELTNEMIKMGIIEGKIAKNIVNRGHLCLDLGLICVNEIINFVSILIKY